MHASNSVAVVSMVQLLPMNDDLCRNRIVHAVIHRSAGRDDRQLNYCALMLTDLDGIVPLLPIYSFEPILPN